MNGLSIDVLSVTRRKLIRRAAALGLLAAGLGGAGAAAVGQRAASAAILACGIPCIGPCVCVTSNQTGISCCVGEDLDCIQTTCWCTIQCGANCSDCAQAQYRSTMDACFCRDC